MTEKNYVGSLVVLIWWIIYLILLSINFWTTPYGDILFGEFVMFGIYAALIELGIFLVILALIAIIAIIDV